MSLVLECHLLSKRMNVSAGERVVFTVWLVMQENGKFILRLNPSHHRIRES